MLLGQQSAIDVAQAVDVDIDQRGRAMVVDNSLG